MTFYSNMATLASELISKFGQAVTIKRTTGEVVNPVTGDIFPGTVETFSPNGILRPYKSHLIDGTRIRQDDKELILDDTVKPLLSDELTVNSEVLTIVGNIEISPAGTPLIYKLQVRK